MDPIACGECGAPMVLRSSRFGKFYGCTRFPRCKGAHGAHPDGKPLGTPADSETKLARIEAHAGFDALWKHGLMNRRAAYRFLRKAMALKPDDCHIAKFTKGQCAIALTRIAELQATM